jgi:sialate O-acetylesterase
MRGRTTRASGIFVPVAAIFFAIAATAETSRAAMRLAGVFGDHMVLQQDMKLPVWGRADAGEKIDISIAGQTKSTTAGADGNWHVEFEPLHRSHEPIELRVNDVVVQDIVVGEVWLASGQSNMQYSLKNAHDAAEAIKEADRKFIRFCIVGAGGGDGGGSAGTTEPAEPARDRKLTWVVCSPETVGKFSAVAYFFGRDIQDFLDGVPVGLIGSYVSGTNAEAWTDRRTLASLHIPASTQPTTRPGSPSSLFNAMIAPLTPLPIRGVIWYQGESNKDRALEYRRLFPAMIQGWRGHFLRGDDLPFLFVQLPGNGRRADAPAPPAPSEWAMTREAQAYALKLPNTAMAVTLDLVPPRALLHPKNKSGVGTRLALAACGSVYGKSVEYIGPTFASMKIFDDRGVARIHFTHTGGRLQLLPPPAENLPPSTTRPTTLAGFTIAGDDHKFYWADATIDGADDVIVSSKNVPHPVSVRYGWSDNPEVNLYNRVGLPAAPFRTDDWKE